MNKRHTIETLTEALNDLTTEDNKKSVRLLQDALNELELARKALKAWELWEAELFECPAVWSTANGLPQLIGELYDKWCNEPGCLQQLRNDAMYGTPAEKEVKP